MALNRKLWLLALTLGACTPEDLSKKDFGFYVWHPDILDAHLQDCQAQKPKETRCIAIEAYAERYENLEQELKQRSIEHAELAPLFQQEGYSDQAKLLYKEMQQLEELAKIKSQRAHRR